MSHPNNRPRSGNPSPRRARPALEGLEERLLLYATLGANWVYGARITYSFAPDGASVGGVPSTLFQTMDSRISRADWQKAFHDAAAVWQAVANVNLVEVSDNGMSFGSSGNQQGDARIGDIRVGAIPMGSSTLGAAFAPPPINGGTLAGDIVMNSTLPWKINGSYDLRTVAIHEFGHALGMDHSAIYNADMYAYYVGMKQNLHADDISGIRSVYDARAYDAWNSGGQSNFFWWDAKSLDGWRTSLNQIKVPNLNITFPGQNEWFWITVPADNIGSFTVRMQSSNLSLLTPQVSVFDAAFNQRGTASGTNYGDTAVVTIPGVSAGQGFFIKLSSSYQGGGSGAYGMQVNFGTNPVTSFQPPYTVVPSQPSQGGGFIAMTDAGARPEPGPFPARAATLAVDARATMDEDVIQLGTLIGKGEFLTTAPAADPTATIRAVAAAAPAPGVRGDLAGRLDATSARGGFWTSLDLLDGALSSWGIDNDDALPGFGKRTRASKPA